MKFLNIEQDSSLNNVVTDGTHTVSYRDIPALFQHIGRSLEERHITTRDYLAVECENEALAALLLLFLFEHDYSFLVLPKPAASHLTIPALPDFCRYLITVETEQPGHVNELWQPSGWLRCIPNSSWNGLPTSADGGTLFLKTSGSTGSPKMAVIPHASVQGSARIGAKRLLLAHTDRIALPVPIFHSFGLIAAFLSGVSVGAAIDIQKGANLVRFLQREREFEPNVAFLTPIFCEFLLKSHRAARPYRLTVTAGDRFRDDTFSRYEAMSGCLVNLYGCTELGAIAAGHPDDPSDIRARYVGKPLEDVQLRIEEQQDQDEEKQDAGVVWCRHPFGFEGYIDNQGEAIPRDHNFNGEWYCLKDLGQVTDDGYVRILGRSDHSVKRDGKLVFFSDLEKAMAAIPGVSSVAVLSTGESGRGRNLVAVCVPSDGHAMTADSLKSACFDVMPRNSVPDRIILLESLPLLPSGKLDRHALHARVADSQGH